MSAHTPGPWSAHHDHGWLVVESSNQDLYVKIEKGSAATKHMADAVLIAAAPELLAACNLFVEYEQTAEDDGMAMMFAYNAVKVAVYAAIAKAVQA